jgi:hypothetical protein
MSINYALRRGDDPIAGTHTRLLALVYCTWSEASFSKLLHTPDKFTADEIAQIKRAGESSTAAAWRTCVRLALRRVPGPSGDRANISLRLGRIVTDYIAEPAQVRNRLVHGQWLVALNNTQTAENPALTARLGNLDSVLVDKWFEVHSFLARIVEDMIESPSRAFRRDYWVHIAQLEAYLDRAVNWTETSRIALLRRKLPNHRSTAQEEA